jgi:protein ImuB
MDHLIERLRAKFGDVAEWAELAEAHVPEHAFSYRKEAAAVEAKPSTIGKKPPVASRPLCLLPLPRAIRVIVMPVEGFASTSESRDGQPVAFTHDDVEGFASTQVHRLVHVRGPERIAGQWWNGSGKTRDYFDVADTAGSRFWLFRVMETNQWYLHGIFE